MLSIRGRLDQLEAASVQAADRCGICGANWIGSTYRVLGDGPGRLVPVEPAEFRCIRCGELRDVPAYPVKSYLVELMESI